MHYIYHEDSVLSAIYLGYCSLSVVPRGDEYCLEVSKGVEVIEMIRVPERTKEATEIEFHRILEHIENGMPLCYSTQIIAHRKSQYNDSFADDEIPY